MKSPIAIVAAVLLLLMCIGSAQSQEQDQQFYNSDALVKSAKPGSSNHDVELLSLPIPHPYICLGPSLMGGGYAPLAYRAEAGIDLESTHTILRALGAYDNGHKTNDNDQPNPNGHDRYLEGAAYFRTRSRWFFGMGWSWNQLSTTNYTKGGNRPEFGGGYDWFLRSCDECRRDFSMRVNVDWVTSGSDWQNGSHGPNTTLTFPAPSEKRHWFWRQTIGIYRFHQTVTGSANSTIAEFQRSQKSFDSHLDFGILYRF